MKWILALIGIAALSLSVHAAVAEGENLLVNGSFDAEQVAFPEFWSPSNSRNVVYQRTGGPAGKKPAVLLQADSAHPGETSVRQQGLTLVAGETYKLSAYIKTHFRDEEDMLEACGYPQLDAHRALPGEFRTMLSALLVDARHLSLDQIAERVHFLINDWFYKHILVADFEYVESARPR